MNTPTWDPLNGGAITPNVRTEFGTLETAILCPMATPELYSHAFNVPMSLMEAELSNPNHNEKHKLLYDHQKDLRARGIRLMHPHHPNIEPTMQNMPAYIGYDIYCHDFLGVVDNTAILSTLTTYRNGMREHYRRIMERIPTEQQTECRTPFSWGNAILAQDTLLVGLEHQNYLTALHSRMGASPKFMDILNCIDERNQGIGTMRTVLQNIKAPRELAICSLTLNTDLDTVFAPLPRRKKTDPRFAMVAQEGIHPESLPMLKRLYDKFIVCPDPWAKLGCNILWLDPETPLVAEEARQTTLMLRSLGFNVHTRPVAAFKSNSIGHDDGQSGGWRCVTGVLERANDYDFD